MAPIGIIAGTIFLQARGIFSGWQRRGVGTAYGEALVFTSPRAVFVPRHGIDPERHILPHEINHRANLAALRELGASEVISVNSTGSLKKDLAPGMLVVPDDYILLAGPCTTISGRAVHLTPGFSDAVRRRWLDAAAAAGVAVAAGGTYWQTTGPRLETRAEIRMMANFADLVGMTMASEAVIAQELELPYGALCSVDNFAHGIVPVPLTMDEIVAHARRNADRARTITERYVALFSERP
jgi:5'-methylthioadenosine phosphorylase